MSSTNKSSTLRSWSISFAVLSLFTMCLSGIALGQTTFPGAGGGPIPDGGVGGPQNPGPPVTVTFNVSGLSGVPTNVELDVDFVHSWVGDVVATLTAPDNSTSHTIISYTGNTSPTSFGDSSDLGGLYTYSDNVTANWWNAAAAVGATAPVPLGAYKASNNSGTQTNITPTFAGLAALNGTWTLTVTDGGGGDTGTLNGATLRITASTVTPTTQKFMDFGGDGKADYAQARDTTPTLSGKSNSSMLKGTSHRERLEIIKANPLPTDSAAPADHGTNISWFINSSSDNSDTVTGIGQPATDFITPNDFDGDGKADISVWRGAANPDVAFYILESTTSTIREDIFGQPNDNPAVVADYDGDGSDDVAVYRCPASAGQCTFFYRGSAGGGETTFVPWGFGTFFSIFPNTGDFDGDGKADFNVQRTNPSVPGAGQFVLLRSSDSGVEYVSWGLNTDLVIPGDYDGDGKSDYAVGRLQSGQRNWYILDSDGSTVLNYATPFGVTGDFPTAADYDGDGKTDISVWRPSAGMPDNNFFYVLRSSDSAVSTYEYGTAGDYPPANSKVQ